MSSERDHHNLRADNLSRFDCDNYNGLYDSYPLLTNRQKVIYGRLAHGYSYDQISEGLQIDYNTVKDHVSAIAERLGVDEKLKAKGYWTWVEGNPHNPREFTLPEIIHEGKKEINLDPDKFIAAYQTKSGLYPIEDLAKQLGINYLQIYIALFESKLTKKEIAKAVGYSPDMIGHKINNIKSFFRENTLFHTQPARMFGIKRENLAPNTSLKSWIETRKIQLDEREQRLAKVLKVCAANDIKLENLEQLSHIVTSLGIKTTRGKIYDRRTLSRDLKEISQKIGIANYEGWIDLVNHLGK